jgi:multiple sugar transport system permease protein
MKKGLLISLLIAPTLALITGVSLYPMFYAFNVSVHTTRYLQIGDFVGFQNFISLFQNPLIHQVFQVTLKYVLGSLLCTMPLALLLAVILNRPLRFIQIFRVLILLPWVFSEVTAGMLWSWVLNPSFGPVNYILSQMGFDKILFLGSPETALPTVMFINIWWSYALPTVLILAALQTVSPELYEAARIDGANPWAIFKHVTFPLISPTVVVAAIQLTLIYFNKLTLALVLTGGGPLQKTMTLSLQTYMEAFQNYRMNMASSLGIIILLCNILFSVSYVSSIRKEAAN